VATYGKTDDFPAFYSPVSGYKSPYHFTTIQECAELIDTHNKLGLQNGIVIGSLFYFILFYFILFYFILFYFILF